MWTRAWNSSGEGSGEGCSHHIAPARPDRRAGAVIQQQRGDYAPAFGGEDVERQHAAGVSITSTPTPASVGNAGEPRIRKADRRSGPEKDDLGLQRQQRAEVVVGELVKPEAPIRWRLLPT
jgi:hypothetical protein